MSQNAALPAAVAIPMPEGPPFTSLVRSVLSACPASARIPRLLGFGEERMIGQTIFLQKCRQSARAPAETQRVDAEHGDMRVDVVALVAGGFVFTRQRFAHDHPQRVAGGDACGRPRA